MRPSDREIAAKEALHERRAAVSHTKSFLKACRSKRSLDDEAEAVGAPPGLGAIMRTSCPVHGLLWNDVAPQRTKPNFFPGGALLKGMGLAPLLLRPAPFHGSSFLFGPSGVFPNRNSAFPFSDVRLTPHYPAKSPLADVLRLVAPGSDEYVTEKYAFEIESLLNQWSQALKASVRDLSPLAKCLDASIEASSLLPSQGDPPALRVRRSRRSRRQFAADVVAGRERFLQQSRAWLGQVSHVETAEFEITVSRRSPAPR